MHTDGYVLYCIDIESTGLDPSLHDVIEISMCRMTPKGVDDYEEEQKTWLVKAMNPVTIQDEALRINGHKREDICHQTAFGRENYKEPKQVIQEIEMWLANDNVSSLDRVWLGQNPMFDVNHMQALYKRVGMTDFPFMIGNGNRVIDAKQIVTLFDLCTGRRRKHYNLSSFVKALGVKKGKAHQAAEDVRMTKDIILKLIKIIKVVVAEQFADCYSEEDAM